MARERLMTRLTRADLVTHGLAKGIVELVMGLLGNALERQRN